MECFNDSGGLTSLDKSISYLNITILVLKKVRYTGYVKNKKPESSFGHLRA